MKTQLSTYDQQANDFLARFGISLAITRKDPFGPGPAPAWAEDGSPRGIAYNVCIAKEGRAAVSFDYWGSKNDMDKGNEPTAYDVLACLSGDIYCAETFGEFCSDYGYDEDSRKAFATWERCAEFGRELRAFFPEGEEREALCEIN